MYYKIVYVIIYDNVPMIIIKWYNRSQSFSINTTYHVQSPT